MSNKTNADLGGNIESLFKNSIKNKLEAIEAIKEALHIDKEATIVRTYKVGTDKGKGDVAIRFSDQKTIFANIKSYKIGFNQATRMRPASFIDKFNVPKDIENILTESLIRKAANSKKELFIRPQDSRQIIKYFSVKANDIIKYSICGDEDPELFVLWDNNENTMSIYTMQYLLAKMKECVNVEVSKKGVIYLNPYFTIQRKGGNGARDHHPKTDILHGGNNIQVKITTDNLRKEVKSLCDYSL